jgi:folate-binding protein YgfZ
MHEDLLRDSRRLPQFGALRLSGPDAKSFLQGQVSADTRRLGPESALLASCNSAQGRVQAVLWIIQRGDDVVLLTSAELIEAISARLKKYVLRAKVKFEPATLGVYGIGSAEANASWTAPLTQQQQGDVNAIRWPGNRTLLVATAQDVPVDDAFVQGWQLADIRSGIPTVHPQTHERFVAQMLNLDLLGGISFDKGCYTGQEIIARTHYRGSVKRRMLRYVTTSAPPPPGARIVAGEETAGEVVTATATPEGAELLAVVQLSHVEQQLTLEAGAPLQRLPLPYAVLD